MVAVGHTEHDLLSVWISTFAHMTTEIIDRTALKSKIDALMQYRMLPDLLAHVESCSDTRDAILSVLTDLQIAIYDLDHYLETHWVLDDTELSHWWAAIFSALQRCGVSEEYHQSYVAHIQRYQRHEVQLRRGVFPTKYSMEYFYYYKSCDVKLLRRIIYDRYPQLAKLYSMADWRLFDLITEIDDDVEDVMEDQLTINGNRFLIEIWESGFLSAQSNFSRFLEEIADRIEDRFSHRTDQAGKTMHNWSCQELAKTSTRLRTTTPIDRTSLNLWLQRFEP